jgi:concentrative nucleoside transporter, CNT family
VSNPFAYLAQDGRYMSLFGILAILGIAFLFSKHKRKVSVRLIFSALSLQFFLAFFVMKTSVGQHIFSALSDAIKKVYTFADAGAEFMFGKLTDGSMAWGNIFFLKLFPMIIFFGALMALLFHLGIVQVIVKAVSWLIRPILGTSGAETLCAASNSMLGQTEAPLLVKKYLENMTKSEMLLVMVSGMATLSGSILAVYGFMGVPMMHLLTASVMAIPSSVLISKILMPETEKPETMAGNMVTVKADTKNVLDAISTGTTDGLKLAVNVTAMLIAFIGLIALVDFLLGAITGYTFGVTYTLNTIFAKVFSWVAVLIGIPFAEKDIAGSLLGQKVVINEFVAYANMIKAGLSQRTMFILTYAFAGFANISSIGIQIGGIGALVPGQRKVLVEIGLIALLGGTLANFLNAAIASLFI